MVSLRLTAQLERVKEVLATWKEVDGRVSQLCLSLNAEQDTSTGTACSAGQITAGLVGFLSGNFSDKKWKDEYLGVNATVMGVAEITDNGLKFEGVWAEWPVGSQGENQLYHFANYNFTLVATVTIHNVQTKEDSIPLIGVKMNDDDKTVLLGLSYNKKGKWELLCGGQKTELSATWERGKTHQVAIVLQNEKQGSAYVDGKRVEGTPFELKDADLKNISHFYIGGDGDNTKSLGLSVTVENVLLYNRPLNGNEITALKANKDPILKPEDRNKLAAGTLSREGSGAGADGRGVSSAASTATTPSSNDAQTMATGSGDTMQGEGIQPQDREVNATALSSSLGNFSQGNNSGDGSTVCGSGMMPLLLLLGLWGVAAL
ncbi:trans-sialidase, putative [Trypanosoma cruzi marinkellei]|uniref:Trans-sialidase, putative n=1 Tax=Trypanosoma cruzi marinkellei TaxID=85056 RepID=K2M2Z6_TRYCR|nr:trans-sialidase, putative [Trypanosoma cruzi marinkellei]